MEMRSERRAIDKIYKRRDRYEIPDWQREEVWSTDKKRKLIDTILRGWKLPKFYFQKTQTSPDEFDVVDGQQRLAAIFEFKDGDLSLSSETTAEFGGEYFEDLHDVASDHFDDYEIEYDEITNATDEEVKDFFQRLQEGLPLTTSEKLNSVHSNLRNFCSTTASDKFFSKTTVIADKRYSHFDIVSKVVTIEIEGLDAPLRYEDIRKVFEANGNFSPKSAAAKRIGEALKFLRTFPTPFTPFRNRTIVQSVITLVCHLQEVGMKASKHGALRAFIEEFLFELGRQVELGQLATDADYLEFQRTVNANVKTGARTRQAILLRKLFEKNPTFFNVLSQSSSVVDGLRQTISIRSQSIRDLIAAANERYAGQYGKDLFKPTNKTAQAQVSLGTSATSFEAYQGFIDDLYFIFREGVGQRLDGNVPLSFSDVNELRTMLRHDVDHGKGAKASAKRRQLAATFSKYAGSPSPEALDPNTFPLVQANLLSAIDADLRSLAKSLA